MNNTIAGDDIKEDNISRPCTGCDVDVIVSGHCDFFSSSSLQFGCSRWDVLALQGSSRDNMAEEDGSKSIFVSKQAVLVKGPQDLRP